MGIMIKLGKKNIRRKIEMEIIIGNPHEFKEVEFTLAKSESGKDIIIEWIEEKN